MALLHHWKSQTAIHEQSREGEKKIEKILNEWSNTLQTRSRAIWEDSDVNESENKASELPPDDLHPFEPWLIQRQHKGLKGGLLVENLGIKSTIFAHGCSVLLSFESVQVSHKTHVKCRKWCHEWQPVLLMLKGTYHALDFVFGIY